MARRKCSTIPISYLAEGNDAVFEHEISLQSCNDCDID